MSESAATIYEERERLRKAKIAEAIRLTRSTKMTEGGFYQFDRCPFCGAGERRPRRVAGVGGKSGKFKCFKCTPTPLSVDEFLEKMGATPQAPLVATSQPEPERKRGIPLWQLDPMKYHSRLTSASGLVERWQSYKPVSEAMIMRYQLGYGPLPPIRKNKDGSLAYSMGCEHDRLVYANLENRDRQAVAFRGRQLGCQCHNLKPGDLKWLTIAGGKAWLFNAAAVERSYRAQIIIVEQPIDAILTMQAMPDVLAVAGTAGAGTWRPEWTKLIVNAAPESVLVWLDNDLIGGPNEATREALIMERKAKIEARGQVATQAMINGWRESAMAPKIVADLQRLGCYAAQWQWPDGTPAHMDNGQFLINEGAITL